MQFLAMFKILRLMADKAFSHDERIVKEFQEKVDIIIKKMLQALVRAHRKVDDEKYREALQKLNM